MARASKSPPGNGAAPPPPPRRPPGIDRVPFAAFTEKAYLDYSMYVVLDHAVPALATGSSRSSGLS
ncbi:MAG TPA: hypothetical protein VGV61_12375 [Thermoanaerobaculia bacterium]|nr:hypothetical protein [Thermoanaerobaculia bacterium]